MANYKITNLTNTLGKRDLKFNTTLTIDYVDAMQNKKIQVKPGETIFLSISSLPLSVHKFRVKNLISVIEVSDSELRSHMKPLLPIAVKETTKTPEIHTEVVQSKKRSKKFQEDDSDNQ